MPEKCANAVLYVRYNEAMAAFCTSERGHLKMSIPIIVLLTNHFYKLHKSTWSNQVKVLLAIWCFKHIVLVLWLYLAVFFRVCELVKKECALKEPEDVVWKADMYCAALINGVWERGQICSDVTSSNTAEVQKLLLPKSCLNVVFVFSLPFYCNTRHFESISQCFDMCVLV